eukprot:gene4151-14250_t
MLAAQNRVASRVSRPAFRAAPIMGARRVVARAGAVSEIVEKLKTLTLLEASELVKEIEETFGVDASAAAAGPAMMMAPAGGAPAEVVEEKTAFDIVLEAFPADKKVSVYKVVRNLAGISVAQVKEYTSALPKTICESLPKAEAEAGVKALLEIGATASIA